MALRESATRVFVHYDDGDKSWAVRKRQQWLVAGPAPADSPQREAPLTAAEVLVRSAEQVPEKNTAVGALHTAAARCCGSPSAPPRAHGTVLWGVRRGGP